MSKHVVIGLVVLLAGAAAIVGGSLLLASHQGTRGGYELARRPTQISVADVIQALDGPVTVTACSTEENQCEQFAKCNVRDPLWRIKDRILAALATCSLAEIASEVLPDQSVPLSFFQLLAGAIFTAAVLDALLLGHWYLTDRRLPRGPINRMAWILVGAAVLELAAVVAGGFQPTKKTVAATNSLNPLLSIAGSATLIAVGMVACTGLIAAFIQLTLRGARPTAVQSATGFFYLAVITAFTAELAAKIRFLP